VLIVASFAVREEWHELTQKAFSVNCGGRIIVDIRAQKVFAWSGPASMFMFAIAAYIAGFLPPPSPAATAEQIASIYRANSHSICIAAILVMLSTAPFLLFIAVLSAQLKRIEGNGRTFAYAQLAAGTASMTPIILIPLVWCVAAFRPERSAEVIQAFNDLGFITQVMVTPPAMAQVLVVGLAILSDKRARPIFPRWLGYLSVLCAIADLPGLLCVLYKTGPFAWDGIIASGLPALTFLPWTILMAVMLTKAIKQQKAEG
jgi:hypothetical protein